jgi:glycosyltransferase involved in cell wall biosynthesis
MSSSDRHVHTVLYSVPSLIIGGAEQQLLELVAGLDKRRFHPIVAPLYAGGPLEPEFAAVPGAELIGLDRRGKCDPAPLWRVARLLRERKVDIVHPFVSPSTFFVLLPAILVGTPVKIVAERGGVRRSRPLGARMYESVERQLARFVDVAVANSEAGRGLLHHSGVPWGKTRVIQNGLNPERLRADPERVSAIRAELAATANGSVIGILATLKPAKGHDVLLRAAAHLRARRSDVSFAIVGDGPLRGQLEDLTRRLGLSDHVRFFGFQRRVADFLAACDVLVSSSRDNEGNSNSILEAMALKVPVVATDIGGSAELVEDRVTGHLVPVDDSERLAAAIGHALDNTEQTRLMVECAHRLVVSRFSRSRMVSQYEALYTDLLKCCSTIDDRVEATSWGILSHE